MISEVWPFIGSGNIPLSLLGAVVGFDGVNYSNPPMQTRSSTALRQEGLGGGGDQLVVGDEDLWVDVCFSGAGGTNPTGAQGKERIGRRGGERRGRERERERSRGGVRNGSG